MKIRSAILNAFTAVACAAAILVSASSCGSTGTYWGVDQSYPIGNGQVYYGAYGGNAPGHGYSKKEYKKHRKEQKKLRKQQEKLRKQQLKQAKKAKKHHRPHHY